MKFRVVLTSPHLHPPSKELEDVLAKCDARLDSRSCCNETEMIRFCAGADALLCASEPITRDVILSMPNCRIIARLGTGHDNIDLLAADRVGIPVTNVPEFCTAEVAEHTMALILACCRKLILLAKETGRGVWRPDAVMPAYRLFGKTLGIVGFGKIGRAVAVRALSFGMRVNFFDPERKSSTDPNCKSSVSLLDLFRSSDIISLHLPLSNQTRGLIGRALFEQAKPGAILVNCARGAVVVESELMAALRSGQIGAAGLDTLSEEPPAQNNPLLHLPNVLITPHCAAHSVEALSDLRQQAYAEVARALRGEPLHHTVNHTDIKPRGTHLAISTN